MSTRSARVTACRSAWPWRGIGSAARRALRTAWLRVQRISCRIAPMLCSVLVLGAGAGEGSPVSATGEPCGTGVEVCDDAAAGSAAAAARTHAAAVMRAGRTAGLVPQTRSAKPVFVFRTAEIATYTEHSRHIWHAIVQPAAPADGRRAGPPG